MNDAYRIVLRMPSARWFRWLEFGASLSGVILGVLLGFLGMEVFREEGARLYYFWPALIVLILSGMVMVACHLLKD